LDAPRYEKYSTVPLFEGLKPEEIGALLDYSEEVNVEAGDVVIHEGEPPKDFYIVAEGTLDVIKTEGENPTVLAWVWSPIRLIPPASWPYPALDYAVFPSIDFGSCSIMEIVPPFAWYSD